MDVDARGRMDGRVEPLPLRRAVPFQRHQRRRFAQLRQGQTDGNFPFPFRIVFYNVDLFIYAAGLIICLMCCCGRDTIMDSFYTDV